MVGKTPGRPSPSQAEINAILLREAAAGRHVVRLKGGDPFVFGRGGEELAALRAAGVPVEIVPGVTAAMGCAAAVGLALTERDQRRSLTLLTGHASDGPAEHDWTALARPGQMLAIYMGVGAAGHIQSRLLSAGIDPGDARDRGRERHAAEPEGGHGHDRPAGRNADRGGDQGTGDDLRGRPPARGAPPCVRRRTCFAMHPRHGHGHIEELAA